MSVDLQIDYEPDELTHIQDGERIIFKQGKNNVGFIHYLENDYYIDFCGNINGLVDKQINTHNSELLDILADTPRKRIYGLGTDMLRIFFSEYCQSGEIITLWMKNPKIGRILEKLQEEGEINDFYDNSNGEDIITIEV